MFHDIEQEFREIGELTGVKNFREEVLEHHDCRLCEHFSWGLRRDLKRLDRRVTKCAKGYVSSRRTVRREVVRTIDHKVVMCEDFKESTCKACEGTGKVTAYQLIQGQPVTDRDLVPCPVCQPPVLKFEEGS